MVVTKDFKCMRKATGAFYLSTSDGHDATVQFAPLDQMYQDLVSAYNHWRSTPIEDREKVFESYKPLVAKFFEGIKSVAFDTTIPTEENNAPPIPKDPKKEAETALKNMINFFKEFAFAPNFRFVNSVGFALQTSNAEAKNYISNYFKLIDSPYAKEISSKVKSDEFKGILEGLKLLPPQKKINTRFKVYFGNAGTGKTTKAQRECDNRCIVCNNSMIPSDLMEDFVFVEGKPSFKPSALWECMTNGLPIVLDEINLLPFDSLRFLQGILDGKKEFTYKGHNVTIADGFEIIGTMNLMVNGAVFNLPEPLVDRCSVMEEFTLSPKDLLNALI